MGATGAMTIDGETVVPVNTMNHGGGEVLSVGGSFTMSASYATGGDTFTQPTSDVKFGDLVRLHIHNPFDGTRWYVWDGSTSTPKIKALSAFATEVTASTDLSANTLKVTATYAR